MDSAIIVRLGADTSGFKKDLGEAQSASNKFSSSVSRGSGLQLANAGKLKRNLSELTAVLIQGGSASDLAAAAAIRLGSSFKIGMGAVGLAVGYVAYKQIEGLKDKADELRVALNDALTPSGSPDFTTLDKLVAKLNEVGAASSKLKSQSTASAVTGYLSGLIGKIFRGGKDNPLGGYSLDGTSAQSPKFAELFKSPMAGADESKDKSAKALSEAAQQSVDKVAKKKSQSSDVEDAKENYGQHAAELLKIQNNANEKLGEINAQRKALLEQGITIDAKPLFAEARREFEKQIELEDFKEKGRKYSLNQSQIEASIGIGEGEDLRGLRKRRDLASDRAAELSPLAQSEPEELAKATVEANKLKKEVEAIEEERAKSVRTAAAETNVLALQESGQIALANEASIRASYEERILKAQRDQNFELVNQLQKQKDVALGAAAAADFLKTPAQHRADEQNARDKVRAENTVEARERQRLHDKRANDNGFDARFHGGDPHELTGAGEDRADAIGTEERGRMRREHQSPRNDNGFDARFHAPARKVATPVEGKAGDTDFKAALDASKVASNIQTIASAVQGADV